MASIWDFLSSEGFEKGTALAGGVLDYFTGRDAEDAYANAARSTAIDPFGPANRAQYQGLLSRSFGPGFSVSQVPGYAQAADAATNETMRQMAARGYNFAPGALAGEISRALGPLARDATEEYQRMLATLSGGTFAPNAGAFAGMQERAIQQQMNRWAPVTDALSLAGNLGRVAQLAQNPEGFFGQLKSLFGGGSDAARAGASSVKAGIKGVSDAASGLGTIGSAVGAGIGASGAAMTPAGLAALGYPGLASSMASGGSLGLAASGPLGAGLGGGATPATLAGLEAATGAGAGAAGASGLGSFSSALSTLAPLGIAAAVLGFGPLGMGPESTQERVGKIAREIHGDYASRTNFNDFTNVNVPGAGNLSLKRTYVPKVRATHWMDTAFEDPTGNLWVQSGKGAAQGTPLVSLSRSQLKKQVADQRLQATNERASRAGNR